VDPLPFGTETRDERRTGELRHGADPPQSEPPKSRPDVRIRREQAGRQRVEERGIAARRDEDRPAWRGVAGGDRGAEARRRDPDPGRSRQHPPDRFGQPLREDRLRAPQSLEPVGLDLEQAERGVSRIRYAGEARAENGERLEGGLDRGKIRIRLRIEERGLRREPVGAPQRHAPPDPEGARRPVGVDHRPVGPRLAAEHHRARRKRRAARVARQAVRVVARSRQVEGEMRPVEVEQSHGWTSRARGSLAR
jgi:hypothetical protein